MCIEFSTRELVLLILIRLSLFDCGPGFPVHVEDIVGDSQTLCGEYFLRIQCS